MRNDAGRSTAPQSVTRVLQILDALSGADRPLGLAELSRALGTPKSSLAALLRGLVDSQFVIVAEGAYRLGPSAFGLGSALVEARRRFQTSDIIRDGMRHLNARSGETVLFAVADGDDAGTMTYVDMVESRNAIRFSVHVGDRRPLYCTAGGRALLSARTDPDVGRYLDAARLDRLASRTETDRGRLFDAVRRAREEHVARTHDEAAEGVAGIAALIRDASGTVQGALVIAAPTLRLEGSGTRLVGLVREASETISRNLGYRNIAGAA
jgi:DNA-binding IclR family transcriptional regulator